MRKKYPSDISREQFEIIRPALESARKKTRPREVDLYDIFCAVLYILKTGSQWRALPHDFPKWKTVYAYFQMWSEEKKQGRKKLPSILEEVLKINGEARITSLRTEKTSMAIADAQSVKNTESAREKGYDAARKCRVSSDTSRWIRMDSCTR